MTKIIIFLTKWVVIILTAVLITSCQFEINGLKSVDGNQIVKTESREVTEKFTSVEAKTGLEVEIIQGNPADISVIADENLHEFIQTEILDGVLIIKTDRSIRKSASKKVIVTMEKIERLETSSGASLKSKTTLRGNQLNLDLSSGSRMDLEVEFDEITAETSSGSSINLAGKALNARLDSSSGSSIHAEDFKSNVVRAESSSGSSITVFPILELEADASSGSSIRYVNTPKNISQHKSSGASIGPK